MTVRHVFLNGSQDPQQRDRLRTFQIAADLLRHHGYAVCNPIELGLDNPLDKDAGLRSDIEALLKCDAMALLPGWNNSGDAKLLVSIAARLGIQLYGVNALLQQEAQTA